MQSTVSARRVITSDAATIDVLLSSAEEQIIPYALALNQGIRVTCVGPGDFVVQPAEDVACGYTVHEYS